MEIRVRWDEQEALDKSAQLLAECGQGGSPCWALRAVLDAVIEGMGPWWLAHFLATTPNREAAEALEGYLEERWPAYAETIEQLTAAADWSGETSELERDFGGD